MWENRGFVEKQRILAVGNFDEEKCEKVDTAVFLSAIRETGKSDYVMYNRGVYRWQAAYTVTAAGHMGPALRKNGTPYPARKEPRRGETGEAGVILR